MSSSLERLLQELCVYIYMSYSRACSFCHRCHFDPSQHIKPNVLGYKLKGARRFIPIQYTVVSQYEKTFAFVLVQELSYFQVRVQGWWVTLLFQNSKEYHAILYLHWSLMLMGNVKIVVLIFLVAKKKRKNRFPGEKAVCPCCFPVAPLALWQPLHQSFFKIKSFIY